MSKTHPHFLSRLGAGLKGGDRGMERHYEMERNILDEVIAAPGVTFETLCTLGEVLLWPYHPNAGDDRDHLQVVMDSIASLTVLGALAQWDNGKDPEDADLELRYYATPEGLLAHEFWGEED
jgi:hypothetical protein